MAADGDNLVQALDDLLAAQRAFFIALVQQLAQPAAPTQGGKADGLLTSRQLAARIGIGCKRLERLAREDRLPHMRLGRSLRFRYADVLTALSERQRTHKKESGHAQDSSLAARLTRTTRQDRHDDEPAPPMPHL